MAEGRIIYHPIKVNETRTIAMVEEQLASLLRGCEFRETRPLVKDSDGSVLEVKVAIWAPYDVGEREAKGIVNKAVGALEDAYNECQDRSVRDKADKAAVEKVSKGLKHQCRPE